MAQELARGETTVIGTETWRRGKGHGAGELDREKKRKWEKEENEDGKEKQGSKKWKKQKCERTEYKADKDADRGKKRNYVKERDVVKKIIDVKRERLGIGAWNVRTLNVEGKLWEVKRNMELYGLSILGMSEVRWMGQGDFMSDGVRVIYSGGETRERGVAIMFDEEGAKRIIEIEQCSDRLMMVKVSATPVDMVLIQVYMPTTKHADEEVEEMYEQIERIINKQKGN